MRLVCPRCGAQYEIDAEAIPARGRDVECSACEHVWRAYPAGFDPAARPALSRPLDESVIEILRGEAARELEARAAEREAERATARTAAALARHAPPDTTLPGDAPETPAEGLVARDAPSRDADPAGPSAVPERSEPAPASATPTSTLPAALTPAARPSAPPAASPLDVPPAADATDGDLTLSPETGSRDARGTAPSDPPPRTAEAPTPAPRPLPATPPATRRPAPAVTRAARARRRHDAGYHLAVMVALVAVTLYALAPRMADQGALGTTLMSWRAQVDEGRIWLDTRADALVARVRGAL